MIINEETVTLRKLTPTNELNWLYNGSVFSQLVYLGKEESQSNWQEVTEEYKISMEAVDLPDAGYEYRRCDMQ